MRYPRLLIWVSLRPMKCTRPSLTISTPGADHSCGDSRRANWLAHVPPTYSTMLRTQEVDVKVQQDLTRHADIRTTMNICTHAIPKAMRAAHGKVVDLLLPTTSGEDQSRGSNRPAITVLQGALKPSAPCLRNSTATRFHHIFLNNASCEMLCCKARRLQGQERYSV
jgi:hypothetical protein